MRLGVAALVSVMACGPGAAPEAGLPRTTRGFDVDSLTGIASYLESEVRSGAFPGAVVVVGSSAGIALLSAHGVLGGDATEPVVDSTIYDLASLTKVVGLTSAVMFLVHDGRLDLDTPAAELVPEFAGPGHGAVRLSHLLTHTSGLPAWLPLYEETPDADSALARIFGEPLVTAPGDAYAYSDLGAILMTQMVERAAGSSLDVFLGERLFDPLGMHDTGFRPRTALHHRIAPTEQDPWRGRMIRGEVHDENAHHLGGVSGHAGLFTTGPDLARFAIWLLTTHRGTEATGDPLLPSAVVREFTSRQPGPEGSTRALGWDTPNDEGGGSAGDLMSPAAFGHTGFTGTSIWIDPEQDLFVVLLTNRVHPTRDNRRHIPVRREVANMAVRAKR